MQVGDYTEDNLMIFGFFWQKDRPYEFNDLSHLQITYELDLTQHRIDRDVYSMLDWVGDVGGLNEGLKLIFALIIACLNFNKFEHFLIEHLKNLASLQKS